MSLRLLLIENYPHLGNSFSPACVFKFIFCLQLQKDNQDDDNQNKENKDNQNNKHTSQIIQQDDKKIQQDDKKINQDDKKIERVYSVKKNPAFSTKNLRSSINWWKWLATLDIQRVKITQDICKDMMKVMAYTEIQTYEEVDPASLITNFCINQNITFCNPP